MMKQLGLCLLAFALVGQRAQSQELLARNWGAGLPVIWAVDAPAELPAPAEPIETAPAADETAPAPAVEGAATEGVVVDATPAPPPKIWDGSFELGNSGSSGNSKTFNFTFGFNAKRKTDFDLLTINANYLKNTSGGVQTANRLFSEARNEWLWKDSRWTPYLHGTLLYDEFQAFDVRVQSDAGCGYQFVNNDITRLVGRTGFGASREIGGPDDSWAPEAVFGLDLQRQLTKRQKVTLKSDYFPDVRNLNHYRINTQASWLLVIDEAANLSLKLSILDRYDSTPHGKRPNDFNYNALLLWSF